MKLVWAAPMGCISMGCVSMGCVLALLAGCGSFTGGMDGGRLVTGKGTILFGEFRGGNNAADVNLDGKAFHVTPEQVTWSNGGSVALPVKWKSLVLTESMGAVAISVDGWTLTTVTK